MTLQPFEVRQRKENAIGGVAAESLVDTRARALRDLRISVTDRCNFRCRYCMPREVFGRDFEFLPRSEILTFEEIVRITRVFVGLGVQKVRLTGALPRAAVG